MMDRNIPAVVEFTVYKEMFHTHTHTRKSEECLEEGNERIFKSLAGVFFSGTEGLQNL